MFLSINDESDDQTGLFHNLIKPAFAPEADIVKTGADVFATLWNVDGSNPPATTGILPLTASFESNPLPLLGKI